MMISPFTPLCFSNHRSDGVESRYVQTFAHTDHILLEVIRNNSEESPVATITNIISGYSQDVVWNTWEMNDNDILDFHVISGLTDGTYIIEIGGKQCQPFFVTSVERELRDTVLVQYCMKDNKQRKDAVFFIDGMQYFFDLRVPGGFKDSGWSFGCDNEQFTTDTADIVELYALDSVQKKFTLGNGKGCPIWFGEMLNRLLCCSYVYFDGVRYARKDSSTPEASQQLDTLDSFIFTQQLQIVRNLNPAIEQSNQLILRRTEDTYRINTTSESNNLKIE